MQNTPLHPIAEWGRQRFGGAEVPAEQRLADLENTLTLIKLDPAENVPLLAPLLDMPLPKERTLTLAPDELRQRQFAALIGWTIASARVQPLVLAFEDLHWADPTPWSIRSHHGTISDSPCTAGAVHTWVGSVENYICDIGEIEMLQRGRTLSAPRSS